MDPIKCYHRQRRIFFVNPNGLIYHREKFQGTHEQWSKEIELPAEAMQDWARGFYWPKTNELFFYVGDYTTDYERVTAIVRRAIDSIANKVGANMRTKVHGGMISGEPGTVWTPVMNFGTISEFGGTS